MMRTNEQTNNLKNDLEALFARMPYCERDAVFEQNIKDYISKAEKARKA